MITLLSVPSLPEELLSRSPMASLCLPEKMAQSRRIYAASASSPSFKIAYSEQSPYARLLLLS